MNVPANLPKPPRPVPSPAHRKQTFWQIWVPFFAVILLFLSLAVLAAISTSSPTGGVAVTKWAHFSVVYLLIPVLLGGFIFLVVSGLLIYGVARLINILPVYTHILQAYVARAAFFIHTKADQSVSPILQVRDWWTGFRTLFKHLRF
jgi:hypothetical protein